MTTQYPESIDGNPELPLATDNVTQVRAQVVNNLRGAIIAIERELGIAPSGVYSTVRDRLDALVLGNNPGASANATQESFSTSDNQTSFTLSNTPSENSTVMMFVNGGKQQYGTDYTASGTAITWLDNDFTLESTDIVEFWYLAL